MSTDYSPRQALWAMSHRAEAAGGGRGGVSRVKKGRGGVQGGRAREGEAGANVSVGGRTPAATQWGHGDLQAPSSIALQLPASSQAKEGMCS